jgi:hypothetical protein
MPVRRTYQCLDCQEIFEVEHASGNEPDAKCPYCVVPMEWRPQGFAIKTNASRAMDYTQQVLEQDYGVTNINDRQREGDVAAISPAETRAQRDEKAQLAEQVRQAANASATPSDPAMNKALKSFWGAGGQVQVNPARALQDAKQGPQAANPMRLLHRGLESGAVGDPLKNANIIGKA